MQLDIANCLELLFAGKPLSAELLEQAVTSIMKGNATDIDVAALLTALRSRPETSEQLLGAARAMRHFASRIETAQPHLLDTCGTGGDCLGTFNISTATAVVLSACGVAVAKHGNRSVSSRSGSADVLEALGVNLTLSSAAVGECIDQIGIGFCFAPLFHGAMKHAAAVRKQLGFRTLFNLLGPLTNPAGAKYQLIGTISPRLAEQMALALCGLGTTKSVVVCGGGELDEVSLWGETTAFIVEGSNVSQQSWSADTFGLPGCTAAQLAAGDANESAAILRRIFDGATGPHRNIVLANAAAGLWLQGHVATLPEGVQRAAEVLDKGLAKNKLQQLIEVTAKLAAKAG